jgi:hypothetical protein
MSINWNIEVNAFITYESPRTVAGTRMHGP